VRFAAAALKILVNGIEYGYNWVRDLVSKFMEGTTVGRALGKAFEFVGDILSSVWETIKGVWNSVTGFFDDVIDKMEAVGIQLDAATDKQKKFKDAAGKGTSTMGVNPAATSITTDIVNKIQTSRAVDGLIRIAFDNMPSGMRPIVKKEKGGKVEVREPRGAIMPEAI
jgi:phage-related protein